MGKKRQKRKTPKRAARKKAAMDSARKNPTPRKRIPQDSGDILLFKYRPINKYLLDSLVKSQLHFALPADLNDPYDCQVDLPKAITRAARLANKTQAAKLRRLSKDRKVLGTIKRLLRDTAVCSFSSSLLNPVLWSHYAEEHRGVSLLYKIPQSAIGDTKTGIVGWSGVEYTEDALTNWLVSTPVKPDADYFVSIIKHMLTIKGPEWAYEGESRILRNSAGQLEIDRSYLTQICFGLRTPDSDQDLIRKIVDSNYAAMDFCQIEVGDSDFGLEARDI